jgi:hypothetical protein
MKTFREFVGTNEHLSENVFDNIKNAATMYRLMTGIDKMPNFGPFKAPKIRAPLPTSKPAPVPTTRLKTPHLAAAGLGLSANNTADGTLDAAKKRGDLDKKPGPDQGVGVKPRVAAPYTPPRPRGMSNIPPAEAQPGSPSYVPPTRSVTTERPKPKPTGPVTSAQAIASGSKEGQGPKSAVSTYRDKADTKGTSVGRYRTLAQHRAAVAAQKNKM